MKHLTSLGQVPAIIFLDFDGVISDNRVITNEFGHESIVTSKYDSYMLKYFREQSPSIHICVISSEVNNVIKKRCEKLNIECFSGASDKVAIASKYWMKKN